MARKSDIQYIRLYVDGSAARQYELPPQPKKKTRPQPRPRRQKAMVLHVDLVAAAGILVAAVMLVLMLTGMSTLTKINNEVAKMEDYVAELQNENQRLRQEYQAGYNLDEIRTEALALGMIPVSRADHVQIHVEPAAENTQTDSSSFWSFLTGLFA